MNNFIIYSNSLENFILDLSSYVIILLILLSLYIFKYIDKKLLIFFSIYSLTPFLFNDILIPSEAMWDQYTNLLHVLDFREAIFNGNYSDYFYYHVEEEPNKKFIIQSHIYGIIPFISMHSVNSLAFINKLILILTSIYLLNKNYIKKIHLLFLLLLPSTIIYSSLSLKEILLCVSTVWMLIFLIEKKYIFFIITTGIFFFIRTEFYSLVVIFILYYLIHFNFSKYKKILLLFNVIILVVLVINKDRIAEIINGLVMVYGQEDVGWGGILNENTLVQIDFGFYSAIENFKIIFNKLILNWPVNTVYKIIFFILSNLPANMRYRKLENNVSLLFLFIAIFVLYTIIPNIIALNRFFYPYLFFYIILNKINFKNENTSYNN